YHMLVGRPGFDTTTSNITTLIYTILEKGPTPPSQYNPALTAEVEAVVMRALQRDPAQRFERAEKMSSALNQALGRKLDEHPVYAPTPLPNADRPKYVSQPLPSTPTLSTSTNPIVGKHRRTRLLMGGAFLVMALLISGLIFALATGGSEDGEEAEATTTQLVTLQNATVLAGETGVAADVVPSQAQITAAQARVSSGGFVAYIACTQETDYHAKQAREMRDLAAAYGIELRVYDADTDSYQQVTLVERARADGATGLIVCPLDPELLDETLKSVQAAKIPLVLLQSAIPSYGGVKLTGDEYAMGLRAGQYAGQLIRDELDGIAQVVILDYPDMPAIVLRANGIEEGILEYAPNAAIVGRYIGGTPAFGKQSVQKLVDQGVDFDMIVSINDAGAIGAIEVLEDAGIGPDDVMIVGIDAETQALDYIRRGYYFRASEEIGRQEFSTAAVNAMVRLLAGSTMPEVIRVPPGQMVTRENLPEPEATPYQGVE
ncbi:MAG: substrate-binding domain-containing protein, partial [Anaerolineae bacterium]